MGPIRPLSPCHDPRSRVRLRTIAAFALMLMAAHGSKAVAQTPSLAAVAAETASATPRSDAKRYGDADLKPAPARSTERSDTRAIAGDAPAARGAGAMREDVLQNVMPSVVTIEAAQSSGSGFFVARDIVVTNHHVVGDNATVRVRLLSGDLLTGSVTRIAADADLAIVRLDDVPAHLSALTLAPANSVRVGEDVMVLGSALGMLQGTVTRGIVSAVRSAGGLTLLQTDAAINPGNSGGPVINSRGTVVGVTTAKMNGAESLGFAIASEHAARLVSGAHAVADMSASSDATPFNGAMSGQPSGGRDADREAGGAQYDATVRSLSAQADQLDAYWMRYRAMCQPGQRTGRAPERREWFGIWDAASRMAPESSDCAAVRRDIITTASALDAAMSRASESARRAGVFPGETRAIRERYAMTWQGWDR